MKQLSKEEMKKIIGGMIDPGKTCTGQCGGGDSSPWSMDCTSQKLFGDESICTCPRADASWSNCKMS
ncbi:MAG: bacteriocin [Chitinophagaceae bacterium]|nr:bacteriocin [Chitinophagaceae bacterium]